MRKCSVFLVVCFASLLVITSATARIHSQSADAAVAQASVPRLIRFSGTLGSSEAKPGGLVGVEFAIYKEESGGAAVWSEIQNVEADSSGHFTVLLGATKLGVLPLFLLVGGIADHSIPKNTLPAILIASPVIVEMAAVTGPPLLVIEGIRRLKPAKILYKVLP